MTITNLIKNSGRAAVVALALGGTALVSAAPAQAASPSVGFQLNFGNGGNGGTYHGPRGDHYNGPRGGITLHFGDYEKACLTNSQIRASLRNKGYSDVRLVSDRDRSDKVWAVGYKNHKWYQMRVDACSGKVDRIKQIKRRSNGTFSLSFSF